MTTFSKDGFQLEEVVFKDVRFQEKEGRIENATAEVDLSDYKLDRVKVNVEVDGNKNVTGAKGSKKIKLSEAGIWSLGYIQEADIAITIDQMGKVTANAVVPIFLKDIKLDALGRNIKADFIVKFTTGGVTAMAEGGADVYGLKGFEYIIAVDSEDKLTALTCANYDVPVIGNIKLSFNVEPGQRDLTSTQKWEKLSFAGLELISPCI
ncbi:MAG: hypothetical protein GY757_52480, partial [bacterium]|nr:hypothetical protein [bacterium]